MEESPVYLELDRVNAENPEHYRQGGYLPVHIGQRIAKRFKIVHKLGHGGFATLWLAREEDKSRYVALKIVTADQSKTYEAAPEVASLLRNSRGFFLAEHERFFVDSRNGRHLCQVFPVLGPTLDDLTDFHHRLYPECVQDFARQMVLAVDTMHLNGLYLTTRNIALELSQQLDPLSERQVWDMFPLEKEAIELRPPKNKATSASRAPKYAVQAMDLAQLPSKYLSGKLYILDFDQAYPVRDPPRTLLGIPPRYLAPESIFELRNGPPADVWALGCLIFRMRCGLDIFYDLPEIPSNAVSKMYGILGGHLLQHWKTVQLGRVFEYDDFSGDYQFPYPPLRQFVTNAVDLKRPENAGSNELGILKFCARLPADAFQQCDLKRVWTAKNALPISPDEAESFYDLMRRVFEYDPGSRITASNMLAHPWFGGKQLPLPG
ncbi:kinase-like domain-containing protein [Phialemonium atrogriseum]|uniref:Kinase-like domain-containing protein n=1 Tax=Phialemonium atrogriseum TaxID=1093897 RepID=A0AAJ0BZW6_9PEZI|nr:kinase-like domain-containing protein [Phialemonium atrogriseum]KAK1767603.1 kinase-like domain-containing protein [Phialemonium atrogriseum]